MSFGGRFPLFQGPPTEASNYHGEGVCCLCSQLNICLELGIGHDLILACPSCATENALDADDRTAAVCACGAAVAFPALEERILCCCDCLRAGRAAITQQTDLGLVRWQDANLGQTFGGYSDTLPTIEVCEQVTGVILSRDLLLDLVRTPNPKTWQTVAWPFCCARPMIYLRTFESLDEVEEFLPDGDVDRFLLDTVEDWEEPHDSFGIYLYLCQQCLRQLARWDQA